MPDDPTLLVGGDVHVGTPGTYPEFLPHGSAVDKEWTDPYNWLSAIAPVLRSGDVTLANLEGPICQERSADETAGSAATGPTGLRMRPAAADALRKAGFDAVTLANNISMNLGPGALLETLDELERVGIDWAGAGRDESLARQPAICETQGVRVAVLSYTSVFRPEDFPAGPEKPGVVTVPVTTRYEPPENVFYNPGIPARIVTEPDPSAVAAMREDVSTAATRADVVVVCWHWGFTRYACSHAMGVPIDESPFYVLDYQEQMGRAAVDAGADLVVGTHPHRLQGMERYDGGLICYSLGNLAFSFAERGNFGPKSVVVRASLDADDREISSLSLVPVELPHDTMEPRPATPDEASETVTLLDRLSEPYDGEVSLEGETIRVR